MLNLILWYDNCFYVSTRCDGCYMVGPNTKTQKHIVKVANGNYQLQCVGCGTFSFEHSNKDVVYYAHYQKAFSHHAEENLREFSRLTFEQLEPARSNPAFSSFAPLLPCKTMYRYNVRDDLVRTYEACLVSDECEYMKKPTKKSFQTLSFSTADTEMAVSSRISKDKQMLMLDMGARATLADSFNLARHLGFPLIVKSSAFGYHMYGPIVSNAVFMHVMGTLSFRKNQVGDRVDRDWISFTVARGFGGLRVSNNSAAHTYLPNVVELRLTP